MRSESGSLLWWRRATRRVKVDRDGFFHGTCCFGGILDPPQLLTPHAANHDGIMVNQPSLTETRDQPFR
jgi:hypothetical protein